MSEKQTNNPYESFRRLSEMWEKGLNDLLLTSIDNHDLIRMTNLGIGLHSRYVERLKRNQELMAGLMNIPTKNDVANVAKLTIQTEEKLDILHQQIWNLQDCFLVTTKEQQELMKEYMEFSLKLNEEWEKSAADFKEVKKLSGEIKKIKKEVSDLNELKNSLTELKHEMTQLMETKTEVDYFKELLKKEKDEARIPTVDLVK